MLVIIYTNKNNKINQIEIDEYEEFSSFILTNWQDIMWAKLLKDFAIIDEYTNLNFFTLPYMEMRLPSRLLNIEYTILSKWSIGLFQSFLMDEFPEKAKVFWQNPEEIKLNSLGITLFHNDKIIAKSGSPKNLNPKIPSDLILVESEYITEQFELLKNLSFSPKQSEEIVRLDQFTMINIMMSN